MKQEAEGRESAQLSIRQAASDVLRWDCRWKVDKWSPGQVHAVSQKLDLAIPEVNTLLLEALKVEPDERVLVEGNLLLNGGIQLMENLLIGAGGTTASNTTAQIGVGNGITAAAATQTALQGASTLYKGMLTGYPARTNQTLDFRSEFISGEAEFAWEEWAIRNDATAAVLLNRKVEALGTKAAGSVWTITGSITIT